MMLSLQEIATLVGGQLHGNPALEISGADTIRDSTAGQITFADRAEAAGLLAHTAAVAVLVNDQVKPVGMPYVLVSDVRKAFATVVLHFRKQRPMPRVGIDPEAYVSRTASIAKGVDIHPQAYVGDDVTIGSGSVIHSGVRILPGCTIGENTVLFPNVVLYENTVVGDRCLIHSGSVVGAYGFGYSTIKGEHKLCAQLGNVVIENDVDIGACSTIDRGSYGSTVIGSGTKFDDQVMIGHNCKVGQHNIFCAQMGLAGSCSTGDYVVIAGQVGVRDHCHIGEAASIGGQAGVKADVAPGARMLGTPAVTEREFAMLQVNTGKLTDMRKQIKRLAKQVAELEAALEQKPRKQSAA